MESAFIQLNNASLFATHVSNQPTAILFSLSLLWSIAAAAKASCSVKDNFIKYNKVIKIEQKQLMQKDRRKGGAGGFRAEMKKTSNVVFLRSLAQKQLQNLTVSFGAVSESQFPVSQTSVSHCTNQMRK